MLLLLACPAGAQESEGATAPVDAPAPGEAEKEPLFGASLGVGLRMQMTSAIDLAKLAGATGYGEADDAPGPSLGLILSGGVVTRRCELIVEGLMAFGGLALGDIEERYFGAEPEPIGGTASIALKVSARYRLPLSASTEVALGAGAGWLAMGASSPVGGGYLRAVQLGPEAELRFKAHGDGPGGGWFGLGIDGAVLLPYHVSASSGEPLFESDGLTDPVFLVGGAATYRYAWR